MYLNTVALHRQKYGRQISDAGPRCKIKISKLLIVSVSMARRSLARAALKALS